LVKEVLANCRLSGRNKGANQQKALQAIEQMGNKYGVGIEGMAMAYALHQSWASVVLTGATCTQHINDNIKALAVALSYEDLDVLKSLAQPATMYWQDRKQLAWN